MEFIYTLLALFVWFKIIPWFKMMCNLHKAFKSDDWDKINLEVGEWRKD